MTFLSDMFLDVVHFVGGVDDADIERIEGILNKDAGSLQGDRPNEIAGGAFGGSPKGLDLEAQTATAHQHVVDAIEEMVEGLRGYRTNLRKFADDMFFTDDDAQVRMQSIAKLDQATSQHDFHDHGGNAGDHGGDR
jgi:hypothetical protein